MTETALRPADLAPGSGHGNGNGGGWVDDDDDDGSGWWDWSEDPADDGPPYRASRLRRAVALVTALAVVGASMTLLAVVAVDPAVPAYSVSSMHLETATGTARTGPAVTVRFVVTNTSSAAGRARCRVWLGRPNDPGAVTVVTTPRLASGSSLAELAHFFVHGAPAAGGGASCEAAGGRGATSS